MIRNFSDHAANERTFLAWVRTAIAVMAFGFLVAKFDLFLKIGSHSAWAACDDGYVNRSGSWRYISRRFLSSSTPSLVKAMMGSSPVP
jgi:putative membrane protein